MLRKAGREIAVFAFYLALALAMTWPLATRVDTALADLGDPLVNTWILDWVAHALTHAPLELFDAPMHQPARLTLAFSENLIGIALLILPFHLAGVAPIAIYNIALLLGFAFAGYGAFVLARMVTRSTLASLVGGIVFAFVPFKFDHLSHMQLVWSGWLPMLLAAVIAYWRAPSRRTAALLTGAFVMNGLTNIHYFLFGSLTAVVTVAAHAVLDPRRDRKFWRTLVLAFAIGGILLLPVLLPYRIVSKEYGMKRWEGDAMSGSADGRAWLVATPRNIVYGDLWPDEWHRHEMQLWPGLIAILLAAIGVITAFRAPPAPKEVRKGHTIALDIVIVLAAITTLAGAFLDRVEIGIGAFRIVSFDSADVPMTVLVVLLVIRFRHKLRSTVPELWAAGVWTAIGVLGSLGMHTFFHQFLFRRVPVFQAIRAPARWAVIAYIGLAVLAAAGAKTLMRRRYIGAILIGLCAIDLWPHIRWVYAVPEIAPVYRWLAQARVAPLIELPASGNEIQFRYLLGSTVHHLPQFNGIEPNVSSDVYRALRTKSDAGQYDHELVSLLETSGCKLVIVHAHALASRDWLGKYAGRLAFVRHFDHEIGGDWVFAVVRNLPDWQRLRAPEVPDGLGLLPNQELARMLAGKTTHSDAILTMVESPQQRDTIRGPLHVRGWTLSPFGIRRVTILLDGGSARLDATRSARPDVKQVYHWYYFVEEPGFSVVVERRPNGVPRATDVQVEVEDQAGRVMRTEDLLIDWE